MEEKKGVSRRAFLGTSVASGAAVTAAAALGAGVPARAAGADRIAFVTANLVAQVTDWRFELAQWGEQHKKTVAATDEATVVAEYSP